MVIAPHPELISPKERFLGLTSAPAILAVGCPQTHAQLPYPAPSLQPSTTATHHQSSHLPGLFLQALPGFLHTHFSADTPARPQGASRGPQSMGQELHAKDSCDPQLQGGRHPLSTPPFTNPPPPSVSGWGRRGAPPCRTEAPSPGRTRAGAMSHSVVSPVSPGGQGQGSLPPSPPLPPLLATSSSADWPTLGAMRNSRSNKVPGPHVPGSPIPGGSQTPAGLGVVGTVVRVKGPPLLEERDLEGGPLRKESPAPSSHPPTMVCSF